MVMSWHLNSMNNDIGQNSLLYQTVMEIWDAAKETYSDFENLEKSFEIEGQSRLASRRLANHSILQNSHSLLVAIRHVRIK